MTLSRREGVDIRPTLLRVLTDLYVQARAHSDEEARQFIELTSRLIDQVDDATRAAVRGAVGDLSGHASRSIEEAWTETRKPGAACAGRSRDRRTTVAATAGQRAERGAIADGVEFVDAAG